MWKYFALKLLQLLSMNGLYIHHNDVATGAVIYFDFPILVIKDAELSLYDWKGQLGLESKIDLIGNGEFTAGMIAFNTTTEGNLHFVPNDDIDLPEMIFKKIECIREVDKFVNLNSVSHDRIINVDGYLFYKGKTALGSELLMPIIQMSNSNITYLNPFSNKTHILELR